MQNRSRLTDTENKVWLSKKRKGRGKMSYEVKIYKLWCIK